MVDEQKLVTKIEIDGELKEENVSKENLQKNFLLIQEIIHANKKEHYFISREDLKKISEYDYEHYKNQTMSKKLMKLEVTSKRNFRLYKEEERLNLELNKKIKKQEKEIEFHKANYYSLKNRKIIKILDKLKGKK